MMEFLDSTSNPDQIESLQSRLLRGREEVARAIEDLSRAREEDDVEGLERERVVVHVSLNLSGPEAVRRSPLARRAHSALWAEVRDRLRSAGIEPEQTVFIENASGFHVMTRVYSGQPGESGQTGQTRGRRGRRGKLST